MNQRLLPGVLSSVVLNLLVIAPVLLAQEAGQAAKTSQSRQGMPESSITARVDKIFENLDKPNSPGCALAVIKDGRIVYKRGYGMVNLNYSIPITPSTIFNVASMSKQFTATAIVLLAQQGKLALDDDIRKYVPELPEFNPRVTVRHLLHHTSGMRCDLEGIAGWRLREDLHAEEDMLELLSRQKGVNLNPGEKYVYCNSGYELLAVIVKRASGQSFRDFTRTHIFEPLGMKNSFFRDDPSEVVKNVAYGYYPAAGDAFRTSFPNWQAVGATNLHTSVEDLAVWDQNFYEPRVGGPALIQQLQERAVLNNGGKAHYGYSFGSFLKEYKGLPTMELMGGGGGYRAYLMRFPQESFSFICLCNGPNPFELVPKIADLYLAGKLKEASLPAVQLTPQQLASRIGFYWSRETDTFQKVLIRDGKLQLVAGSRELKMIPQDENRFLLSGARVEIRFESATEGGLRVVYTWEGEAPVSYEPVTQFTPSEGQLHEYVGTYINEEVDAIWRVALEDNKLVLRRLKFQPVILQAALRDVFIGAPWTVRFTRDPSGNVTGLVLNSVWNKNIRFTKRGP